MRGPNITIINKGNLSTQQKAGERKHLIAQASTIELVNKTIENAHKLRASDIHLEPQSDSLRLRLRIDGVLQDLESLPKSIHPEH